MADKAVTSEALMDMPKINPVVDAEFEKQQAKYARQQARYTGLNHAIQLEKARNLTEEPDHVLTRVLDRAEQFAIYLQKDDSE